MSARLDGDTLHRKLVVSSPRFYAPHVAQELFGDCAVIKEWGLKGNPGHWRIEWLESETQARHVFIKRLDGCYRRGFEFVSAQGTI